MLSLNIRFFTYRHLIISNISSLQWGQLTSSRFLLCLQWHWWSSNIHRHICEYLVFFKQLHEVLLFSLKYLSLHILFWYLFPYSHFTICSHTSGSIGSLMNFLVGTQWAYILKLFLFTRLRLLLLMLWGHPIHN